MPSAGLAEYEPSDSRKTLNAIWVWWNESRPGGRIEWCIANV